jgi:hypothetical protein
MLEAERKAMGLRSLLRRVSARSVQWYAVIPPALAHTFMSLTIASRLVYQPWSAHRLCSARCLHAHRPSPSRLYAHSRQFIVAGQTKYRGVMPSSWSVHRGKCTSTLVYSSVYFLERCRTARGDLRLILKSSSSSAPFEPLSYSYILFSRKRFTGVKCMGVPALFLVWVGDCKHTLSMVRSRAREV